MNHCKRALLALLAILVMSAASSQNITFRQGDNGNSKGYQPTLIRLDKADAEGRYYSVEPDLNAFSKVKGIMVREVDMEYKEYKCVKIENTKGYGIMHAHRDGMRMHVIVSAFEKKSVILRHVCVNLSTFTVESDKAILNREIGKHEFFYHWDATSENGHYGLVYAVANDKTNTADVQGMVFDRSMNKLWAHSLDVNALSQIFVTDDGRIATCGSVNSDEKSDGAVLEFAIADGLATHRGRHTSVYKLGEMNVLNVFGDKVLVIALETDRGTGWAGSFAAGAVVTTGTVYTGCAVYLYDVAAQSMVNTDRHLFSKEDARVFYNASLVSEITSPDVNFLDVRAQVATTSGGAVLYGRKWFEKVVNTKNAMSQSTFYYKGMMVVGADSTGHIAWMKPLMHDNFLNGDFGEYTETDMVAEGNDIYVFTNESRSDGDTYDPHAAAKRAVMKGHGVISAYRFGADGSVAKRKLTDGGVSVIMTTLRRQAPGVYTFISGSRKGCVSEITIGR